MQGIEGILFELVGCLGEFPSEPFHEMASRFFDPAGGKKKPSRSASRSYWHVLNLMAAGGELAALHQTSIESLELQAVEAANPYEDVIPALSELKAMGIKLFVASSLSSAAVSCFLGKHSLAEFFLAEWNRDNAGGVKTEPLAAAISGASLNPERTMFLADTAEGLKVAKAAGVNAILMMNDPDEAKRLSMPNSAGGRGPAGGIVSLHELPDFVRFVATQVSQLNSKAG